MSDHESDHTESHQSALQQENISELTPTEGIAKSVQVIKTNLEKDKNVSKALLRKLYTHLDNIISVTHSRDTIITHNSAQIQETQRNFDALTNSIKLHKPTQNIEPTTETQATKQTFSEVLRKQPQPKKAEATIINKSTEANQTGEQIKETLQNNVNKLIQESEQLK